MANRFGIFYNDKDGKAYTTNTFEEEYVPMSHRNPKTPVHAQCFQHDRDRAALKRKKDSEKKEKESKKKWVNQGCGHASMFGYLSVDENGNRIPHQRQPPNPVTSEKLDQKPESVKSGCEDMEEETVTTGKIEDAGMDYRLTQIARGEYNSPDCSTKSSGSSSSVEVVKTVLPFQLKNVEDGSVESVDSKNVDSEDIDEDDICVQDIEPEEDETNEEADFVCVGCGNDRNRCHQYLFGGWLVQEAISLLDEKNADEITEDDVLLRMQEKYNTLLSFGCWHEIQMYDTSCWYDFPGCLRESSVEYALKVIKNQQVFFHLKNRRQGGIAIKTLRNTSWTKNNDSK